MSDRQPQISVCICTHNPRREVLGQALAAVAAQSLEPEAWELILVDNRSDEPVASWVDLSPFARARVVAEDQLGLARARMRAIAEADGEVIVFVDDDNLLDPDYLTQAHRILEENPIVGIIGGCCRGRFEVEPPSWARRFLPYLAVVDKGPQPIWARHPGRYEPWYPCGAGLTVRRPLAEAYAAQLESDPDRTRYGRRGQSLASAEDIDLILTVMDEGYAAGYFPQLGLTHLIDRGRLQYAYLKRMIRQSNQTTYRLLMSRGIMGPPRPWPLAYLGNIGLCVVQGDWHPLTWLLEFQITRGRQVAYRELRGAGG